jgi:hypothetical protein
MNPTLELIKTPFDEIFLPSEGLFYPSKKSRIKIRHMTGNDELLLSSPYMSQDGTALKLLINNLVLEPNLEYDELLVCDRNAILLFLRSSSYGDDIEMEFVCPGCQIQATGKFLISSIETKDITQYPDENGNYTYKTEKLKICFAPVRLKNEQLIKSGNLIDRYMAQITSINDSTDKNIIHKHILSMRAKESKSLREYMDKVEPGFQEIVMFTCPDCQEEIKDTLKIDENFLKLPDSHILVVREECFLCYYYGKGGITRGQVYEMTIDERRWTINRITKEVEKQNEAEQKAMDKAKSKR